MKNINIPEPCSENWNEMTPTAKGAFCKKCAFDVFDFTNKSAEEIRGILTQNIGSKVCGHINPSQLNQLNADFEMWRVKDQRSFQRAWIFSLFVVFGMTLFSCAEDEKPAIENIQKIGQVILTESTTQTTLKQHGTQNKPAESKKINLDSETVEISETPEREIHIRGLVSYDNEVPIREHQTDSVTEIIIDPNYEIQIDGGMMWSPHYENYLIEAQDDKLNKRGNVTESNFTALIYPNPAVNETTLKVNLPEKAKGEIELVALSGQKIKTIHSGRLQKGETTFTIDVTDLKTGNYLIVIYANGQKETVQFTKL